MFYKYVFSGCGLPFYFFEFWWRAKGFLSFFWVSFFLFNKSFFSYQSSQSFSSNVTYGNFIVLKSVKSMTYLTLIFVYGEREGLKFVFFYRTIQLFQHQELKRPRVHIELPCPLYAKTTNYINEILGLYVYPYASTILSWLLWLYTKEIR